MTARQLPLTKDELEIYSRRGWVAVRGFYSPVEVQNIKRWTDDLALAPEVRGRQMVYHEPSLLDGSKRVIQRIENFVPYFPGFAELALRGRLMEAIEQLIGSRAVLFKDKINFKMSGGAGFEPHQDQQAGWSAYAPEFITALVSVDRATVDNGCLEMADIPRLRTLIGEEWKPLTNHEMSGYDLVPVPTEPGDVVFFDSYAPHGSKPNLGAGVRRVLYLTYNAASHGDHRERYFADKRANFPPDIERLPGVEYKFRV